GTTSWTPPRRSGSAPTRRAFWWTPTSTRPAPPSRWTRCRRATTRGGPRARTRVRSPGARASPPRTPSSPAPSRWTAARTWARPTAARPPTWALSRRAARPTRSRRCGRTLQHHLPRERLVHPAEERAEGGVVTGLHPRRGDHHLGGADQL